jgi:cell division septation protein DedD
MTEHDVVDPAELGRAVEYVEEEPTPTPTEEPTEEPTAEPTEEPSEEPTPTEEPTAEPTDEPTAEPTETPETPSDDDQELSPTGGEMGWGLGLGAVFMIAAGLVISARIRRRV